MEHSAPTALIVACEYSIGLSRLPKVLSLAGCRVTVLGPAHALAGRSCYTDEFIETGTEPREVMAALRTHLDEVPPYDFVTLGDDCAMLAIAEHWDKPWVKDWLPVEKTADAISIATSKLAFGDAMLAAGAAYPKSLKASTLEEASTAAVQLGYPVLLKAAHGYLGSFVRIVEDPTQLASAFAELIPTGPLQVQKFIDGQVGCTASLYDRGELVAYTASFKSECYPAKTGGSCVREFIHHPDMESICRQAGHITGYHGFAGVDWILDRDGKLHVIEFNARPIPGYHFDRSVTGVDFSAAFAAMIAGQKRPLPQPKPGGRVYMFPQHLLRCTSERDWRGLVHYLPLCGKKDLPWDDFALLVEPVRKKLVKFFGSRGTTVAGAAGRGDELKHSAAHAAAMPQVESHGDVFRAFESLGQGWTSQR